MQDYGGPVGFRILGRRPEWMEWLILQNTNAYEEGFTAAWDGIRHALWENPGTGGGGTAACRYSTSKASSWSTSTGTPYT